jgi:hypothetical protein
LPEVSTTNRSAKNTGTPPTPTAPAGTHQSATDAGLGSPSSSAFTPVHNQGADIDKDRTRTIDALGNTTDSSRDGNSGQTETGGNVR